MTDNVIGRGVIEVSADSTKLKAGINDAKTSLQGLKDAAKSAGETLTGQSTNYLKTLERQAAALERQSATFGKSKAEVAAYNAAQLGVSSTAQAMVQRIAAAEKALKDQAAAAKQAADEAIKLAQAQSRTTVSAAQTAAALRGVPAQVTDIVTSLQGGQNALTVLFQQGGQLKDMFGGIGNAAKGLGGYLLGLVNPLTIAGAAAAVLAGAFIEGSKEAGAFQKALILTGNFAGQTTGTLSDLAKSISANIGTQGKAADVLTQLASSGKVAGSSLQLVATAAIELERTTGQSIEKTIAQFVDLSDEPAKAAAKLNDSLHFLSTATYQRIAELEDQGKKEEAAAVAQQAYAQAVNQRTTEVEKSLGILPRAWRTVADAAKSAWDAMMNVGRENTLEQQLASVREKLAQRGRSGVGGLSTEADTNPRSSSFGKSPLQVAQELEKSLVARIAGEKEAAAQAAKAAATQQAGIAAATAISKEIDSSATKQQKMNKELETAKRNFDALRAADPNSKLLANEQSVMDNIRAKYKESVKPVTDDAATKMLQTLREQEASLREQLDQGDKLGASEQARAKFVQQIADLKEKKVLTADQKSLLANQDAILAQMTQNVWIEKQVQSQKELADQEKKRQDALKATELYAQGVSERLASLAQSQSEQYDRQLSVVGLGSQAREQLNSTKEIYRQYQALQDGAAKQASTAGTLDSDAYTKSVQEIVRGRDAALKANQEYYAQLKVMNADWSNGANQAFNNYFDMAANIAKQTEDVFTRAFSGLEDTLVTFVTTGKLSFTSLANSIIADLVRMQAKALISGFFGGSDSKAGLASLIGGNDVLGTFIGLSGGFGARAAGGPVSAGSTYLVGEKGPELLRMGSQAGSITPNSALVGGGPAITINNQIGSNVSRTDVASAVQMGMRQTKADILETLRQAKVI